MNESSAARTNSWASTVHTPGPGRRGGLRDHEVVFGQTCAPHPHHGQPDVDDIGMRWAVAWYHNVRSMTSKLGETHVAA
jgi:hypothetical protein